jgi:hypothetical protein
MISTIDLLVLNIWFKLDTFSTKKIDNTYVRRSTVLEPSL